MSQQKSVSSGFGCIVHGGTAETGTERLCLTEDTDVGGQGPEHVLPLLSGTSESVGRRSVPEERHRNFTPEGRIYI